MPMPSADLRFIRHNGAGLEAVCRRNGCGGCRTLDVEGLAQRYGEAVTIDQLEPRLRCEACGRLGMEILAVALRHGPVTQPPLR